jgi:hypothetical protein
MIAAAATATKARMMTYSTMSWPCSSFQNLISDAFKVALSL